MQTNQELADEFATPGTLKYFLLQLGFMPDNEEVAKIIIKNFINVGEKAETRIAEKDDEIRNLRLNYDCLELKYKKVCKDKEELLIERNLLKNKIDELTNRLLYGP